MFKILMKRHIQQNKEKALARTFSENCISRDFFDTFIRVVTMSPCAGGQCGDEGEGGMRSSLLLHQLLLRIMEDNDTLYYYDYEEAATNHTHGDIFLNLSLDLEFPGAGYGDSLEEECGPDGKQLVLDTFAQVTTSLTT